MLVFNMIRENISDNLKLPKEVLLGASVLHVTGQYEIYIENYKRFDSNVHRQLRSFKINERY